MATKDDHERQVFVQFLNCADLDIDVSSVCSRQPPEPDILCTAGGNPLYFELGRLLDNEMQRMKLHAARRAPAQVSFSDYDVKLPERELLRLKIDKSYATNDIPVELLLYYDNTNWLVGDVPAVADFSEHALHVMQPLMDKQTQFRRVWVFERHRPSVLWKYPG